MLSVFKELIKGVASLKKVLLFVGGVGGAPVYLLSNTASQAQRTWEFVPSSETKGLISKESACNNGNNNQSYVKIVEQNINGSSGKAIALKVGTKVFNKGNGRFTKAHFDGIEYLEKSTSSSGTHNNNCWKVVSSSKQELDKSKVNLKDTDLFLVAITDKSKVFITVAEWKNINKSRNQHTALTISKINKALKEQKDEQDILMNNRLGKNSLPSRFGKWKDARIGSGPNFLQYYGCLVVVNKDSKVSFGEKCSELENSKELPKEQDGQSSLLQTGGARTNALAIVSPIGAISYLDGKIKIGNSYEWDTQSKLVGNFNLIK